MPFEIPLPVEPVGRKSLRPWLIHSLSVLRKSQTGCCANSSIINLGQSAFEMKKEKEKITKKQDRLGVVVAGVGRPSATRLLSLYSCRLVSKLGSLRYSSKEPERETGACRKLGMLTLMMF